MLRALKGQLQNHQKADNIPATELLLKIILKRGDNAKTAIKIVIRLMNVMGGTVIETESDKIKIRLIIELGQEDGQDYAAILKRLQEKIIGLPLSRAEAYLAEYGKRFA